MAGVGLVAAVLCVLLQGVGASPNIKKEIKALQEQLSKQGEADEAAHDKLGCWCQENQAATSKVVDSSRSRSEDLSNKIEQLTARSAQLNIEVEGHQKDLAGSQQSLDKASSIRERENDKYKEDEESHVTSVQSLEDALSALRAKHPTDLTLSALRKKLQVNKGPQAKKMLMLVSQRLRGSQSPDVVEGVLKQMKGTFEGNLDRMRADEETSTKRFDDIVSVKKQQLDATQSILARKQKSAADVVQDIALSKKQRDTADKLQGADTTLFLSIKELCKAEEAGFTKRKSERQAEVVALSEVMTSLAEMPPSQLAALAVSGHVRSPLEGDGVEKICTAAQDLDRKWQKKADSACQDAKAGKAKEAAKAANALREEMLAAQREAEHSAAQCDNSEEEKQSSAELHGAEEQTAKGEVDNMASEIEAINTQSSSNEKMKADLLSAREQQHAVFQDIQVRALHASQVLQRSAGIAKGTAAQAQLNDALKHSDAVAAMAKEADSSTDQGITAVIDAQKQSMKMLSKAVIPLKLAKAQAEESAINAKEAKTSATTPECNPAALRQDAAHLGAGAAKLSDASDSLDFWA